MRIVKNKKLLQTVRGTQDILPNNQPLYSYVSSVINQSVELFGYTKIDTPIFEYSWIFSKSIGTDTDIIAKEMYYLRHREADMDVALRPEGTAGVVRAYYEHGMHIEPVPLRLFYFGPMFRHERPQKNRYRQFEQFGVESIGDADPSEDSLVILLSDHILRRLSLTNKYTLEINSLGCVECRPKYIIKLKKYLKSIKPKLCDQCTLRALTNPMRVFDCKSPKCKKLLLNAPTALDNICLECKSHFKSVLEYLEEADIKFTINPRIVRGLDYYTRTVFEVISISGETKGQAIVAGGRYDNLISKFGKRNAPAVGFGIGIERLLSLLKDLKKPLDIKFPSKVFIVQLGSSAKKKAIGIIRQLSSAGIHTLSTLSRDSLKSQLRTAHKQKAKFALILGQREILDNSIILKDLATGGQETVDLNEYLSIIIERLK